MKAAVATLVVAAAVKGLAGGGGGGCGGVGSVLAEGHATTPDQCAVPEV